MNFLDKIKLFFKPSWLKIAIIFALSVFAIIAFFYFIGSLLHCFDPETILNPVCQQDKVILVFFLPLIWPPLVVDNYLAALGVSLVEYYLLSCVCDFILYKFFGRKLIWRNIKIILSIIFFAATFLLIGYTGYLWIRFKINSRPAERVARPYETLALNNQDVQCEKRITAYDRIEEVDFTSDNLPAYTVLLYEPLFQNFLVYEGKEIGYNFSDITLLNSYDQIFFSAITPDGHFYSVHYGPKMYTKRKFGDRDQIRKKFEIRKLNSGKSALYISGQKIGDTYSELAEQNVSADGTAIAFSGNENGRAILFICNLQALR